MKTCEICGDLLAGSEDSYKLHIRRFHAVTTHPRPITGLLGDGSTGRNGSRVVLPYKVSNRSSHQIIEEMEWIWGKAISPDCRPVKF